jgi:transmembrane protein 231
MLVKPYGNPDKLVFDLSLKIPRTQRIRYIPGILETLKYAWIQYLAIFIPTLLLFKELVGFLFRYKILEANVVSDLNNKRII